MEIHLSGASRPVPLLSSCLPCCPHPLLARLLCQHLLAAITSISASPLFRLLQLGRSNKQHAAAARLHLPSPLHFPVQSLPTLPEASPTFPSGAHIALRSLMRSIYQTGKHRCPFPKQQEGKSLGTALVAVRHGARETAETAEVIPRHRRHSLRLHLDHGFLSSSSDIKTGLLNYCKPDPNAALRG